MTNFVQLREAIAEARNEILRPANERANAVKLQMLREQFGQDFTRIENGFSLGGVTMTAKIDEFNNFDIVKIVSLPKKETLQKFTEAVLYFFEGLGNPLVKNFYPFRCVMGLLIDLSREFLEEIDKEYLEEMLRVGDLYCEEGSGFRKWAFGSYPGSGHYGASSNGPQHWAKWFPEMEEMRLSREAALHHARNCK